MLETKARKLWQVLSANPGYYIWDDATNRLTREDDNRWSLAFLPP